MALLITKSGEVPDMTGLMDRLPVNVRALWWIENNRISDVVSFEKKHNLYGNSFIEEKMGNFRFRISPQSFFQPNTRAAEVLYEKIKEELVAAEVEHLLGLYCGSGVMEIFLSSAIKEVAGIDIEAANISVAEENCRINGIKNCRFFQCAVEDIFKRYGDIIRKADAVIVDPPRPGLSNKALKNITGLGSKRVVYVSCNVSAFARDIAGLEKAGYHLEKLYCIDFFPHTAHLESMGIFSQK